MKFRKATAADIDAIAEIYRKTHDAEEAGLTTIGWIRSIYPTRDTAKAALERGDLFVCELCGEEALCGAASNNQISAKPGAAANSPDDADSVIVASAIINQLQVDVYADVEWEFQAKDEEVSVLHTLVVDPKYRHAGAGRAFVEYWEKLAAASGCPELRMDTNARNSIARAFYAKLSYKEVGIVPTVFNGIPGVDLVMLEKHL